MIFRYDPDCMCPDCHNARSHTFAVVSAFLVVALTCAVLL